ncbi:MAG: ADP-ribosylglycohydrolase family protein [Verrucomicrobiota bacterium]
MTNFQQKRIGLLFGSFVADALSLGVHWIYDVKELSQKFGYIDRYYAPGVDSYHPKKEAGDQGHVGDQALCLNNFFVEKGEWNQAAFMEAWTKMWAGYEDYFDHATKTTLANLETGKPLTEAASNSSELAGPARITPLVAFLANESEATVVQAAVEQTVITHHSPEAIATSEFLARASYQILHGAELKSTLETTAPEWALEKAKAVIDLDAIAAIAQLGQSCSIEKALPAVIYLALKFGDDIPKAFSENAMAGGDNCARALSLGMLLGATHGAHAIPGHWISQLRARRELKGLLARVPS